MTRVGDTLYLRLLCGLKPLARVSDKPLGRCSVQVDCHKLAYLSPPLVFAYYEVL
jgi:hypothetical protein